MICRSGHSGGSGIHHIAVTVRAAGRSSHFGRTTTMWRSLKGSGYLVLSRTALVRFWFNARSARGQPYFGGDSFANR